MFTTLTLAAILLAPVSAPQGQITVTPPAKGWPLLTDASRRAFQFFVDNSHPVTGFTKDRSRNFEAKDSPDHYVSSIAAIGFALSAYAIGAERGWIEKPKAVELSRKTLNSLLTLAPRHRGWYYHWLNWETGKREWKSEVSTIDSAILWCGMILNDQGLKDPEIARLNKKIFSTVQWSYMLTNDGTMPNKQTISMGWHDESAFIKHEWNEYSENAMISLLMLGFDPKAPVEVWTAFERKEAAAFGKKCLTGGPLFMHQMSQVFFDFKNKRDMLGIDYWANSRMVTLLQREYGAQNPKGFKGYSLNLWGISACDIPTGYGAQGFPGWGDDIGTLAPPAAIASAMFTPAESMAAAEAFLATYPKSYGKYGFAGGIDATRNWIAPDVIGIDLGQMMLGIENARDGLPNRLFMKSKEVQIGMKRAGFKTTKEGKTENRVIKANWKN